MDKHWYALQSNYRKEASVYQQLLQYNIQTFFPRLYIQPINPRAQRYRPYFPGYLFVCIELSRVGAGLFQRLPNSIGLVCVGDTPVAVPEEIIVALHEHLTAIEVAGGVELFQLKRGDRVIIVSGPLKGYTGIFETRISESDRVRILLEMLNDRHVRAEVCAGAIQAIART